MCDTRETGGAEPLSEKLGCNGEWLARKRSALHYQIPGREHARAVQAHELKGLT